jgi:hypothetical protein
MALKRWVVRRTGRIAGPLVLGGSVSLLTDHSQITT